MTPEGECLEMFKLERQPAVVPWLEGNIRLPSKFAPRSPGPYSSRQRPYQRWVLECWSPESGVNFCAVSAGTQMLKTASMCLGAAYRMAYGQVPMLLIGTSEKWSQLEISEKRLHPLIKENEVLAALMPSNPDLFKTLSMQMLGGNVDVKGANSPSGLGGGSYGIVAIDECSKIIHQDSEDAQEDHPVELALQRTTDFEEMAFHYLSSTPNIPTHPFWMHVLRGDQTRAWVMCPHCREWFFFDLVRNEEERAEYGELLGKPVGSEYFSLMWDKGARDKNGVWLEEKVVESTRYICPHNGCVIADDSKGVMIEGCEEKRHFPEAPKNRRSFILPSFMSPRIRFGRVAWQFLGSLQDFFGLQTLYNSMLAKPFEQVKRHVKAEAILRLKGEHRRKTIPGKPALLVMTADPGEAATHWGVVAIYPNLDVVLVDWGTVLTIDDLNSMWFLSKRRYQVGGTNETMWPKVGYVDSGDFTNKVYDMCVASRGFWWPTKGANTRAGSWGESEVRSHPGLKLYTYVDHTAKSELWGMRVGEGRGGRVILPADCEVVKEGDGDGLIAGLQGQKLITAGGQLVWKKLPKDHYADVLKLGMIGGCWIGRVALGG